MIETEFQKMPLWPLPMPPAHIPYDEMRAILGLPDVRAEVMLARYRRFADSVSGQPYVYPAEPILPESHWTRLIRSPGGAEVYAGGRPPGWTGITEEPDTRTPQERALPRPSRTPPMWANDPTRSRRRRNR